MRNGVVATIEGFRTPPDRRLDSAAGVSQQRAAHENLTPASHRTNQPVESVGAAVTDQASIVIRSPSRARQPRDIP